MTEAIEKREATDELIDGLLAISLLTHRMAKVLSDYEKKGDKTHDERTGCNTCHNRRVHCYPAV